MSTYSWDLHYSLVGGEFVLIDEEVQTLQSLGLTFDQAKVYLALARSGLSTAKTISNASQVTLQDVYRVMPALQKLGLIERAVTVPVKFQATPLQLGFSILLNRRSEATHSLKTEAERIMRNFVKNNGRTTNQEEESKFVLIPRGEAASERVKLSIENSHAYINIVTPIVRVSRTVSKYGDELKKAMSRDVKIKIITEKPENNNKLLKNVANSMKDPACEIKCNANHPIVVLAICDDKETLIGTLPAARVKGAPELLFSTNSILVELSKNYFDMLWTTSQRLTQ